MGLERLRNFVRAFTGLVEEGVAEEALLARGRRLLGELVAADDWLPDAFARHDPERYQQYLLHCDPAERFSVVSFVWGPGQRTPVHDHTVWGLIGMLRGEERSRRFDRREPGAPLAPGDETVLRPAWSRRCRPISATFIWWRTARRSPVDQHPCLRRQHRRGAAPRLRSHDGCGEEFRLRLQQRPDAEPVGPLRGSAARDLRRAAVRPSTGANAPAQDEAIFLVPPTMPLILVSWHQPHRVSLPVRWRWGGRLILGL